MTTITINIEPSAKTSRAVIFDIHQELAEMLLKYQNMGLIKGMILLDNGNTAPIADVQPLNNQI
jgi:hypothetical protein